MIATEQKIIPNGWESKKIKDLLSYERPDAYIVKNDNYTSDAKTPVLTANKSFILGYTNEDFGVCKTVPAIIFDDFTTDSKYVDFPFKIKSSAIKILRSRSEHSNLKFIFELIRSINFPIGNHKRYYISEFQDIDVVVPPWKEQQKISEILSVIDSEIQKTEEIISQTEKLKNGLMQDLFTRGIGHKEFKETSVGMIPKEWAVVTVKSVTKIITKGTTPTTYGHSFTNEGVNFFKIENIDNNGNIDLSKCKHISETTHQFLRRSQLLCNDILFSIAGAIGRIAIVRKEHLPANTNQAIAIIRPTENINATYLSKILGSNFAQRQVMGKVVQLAQANINLERLGLILIPLPTLNEQKKITDILLSVDQKITTDIKYKKVLIKLKKGLASDLLSGKVRVKPDK